MPTIDRVMPPLRTRPSAVLRVAGIPAAMRGIDKRPVCRSEMAHRPLARQGTVVGRDRVNRF